MIRGFRLIAMICSMLTVAVLAATAAASTSGGSAIKIEHVGMADFPKVRVSVGLANPSMLTDLQVTENGHSVSALDLPSQNAPRAIAVAVDTSNSMQGARLSAVIHAASLFVQKQRGSDALAVYGFAKRPYIVAKFPAGKASALRALNDLSVGGPRGTATYGLIQQVAGGIGQINTQRRVLVLVTDGQSLRDTATLNQAISAAQTNQLVIYPVVIATPLLNLTGLRRLASATGGQLIQARNLHALARVYGSLAREVSSTYTFSYHSYVATGTALKLKVSSGSSTAEANVQTPGTSPISRSTGPMFDVPTGFAGRIALILALIAGAFATAILAARFMARY